jgi:protein kinase A
MKFGHMPTGLLHKATSITGTGSNMAPSQTTQQEKDFVAHFSDQQHVLPPEEVLQDPRNKDLGHSSKSLSVRDFELVRTLGTGACVLGCLFAFARGSQLGERAC